MSTELERISELAKQDRTLQFTSLAHLLTVERLGEAYHKLRKDASPGVDGLTAQEYEQDLAGNLQDLHRRLREGTIAPSPCGECTSSRRESAVHLGFRLWKIRLSNEPSSRSWMRSMSRISCHAPLGTGPDVALRMP